MEKRGIYWENKKRELSNDFVILIIKYTRGAHKKISSEDFFYFYERLFFRIYFLFIWGILIKIKMFSTFA